MQNNDYRVCMIDLSLPSYLPLHTATPLPPPSTKLMSIPVWLTTVQQERWCHAILFFSQNIKLYFCQNFRFRIYTPA